MYICIYIFFFGTCTYYIYIYAAIFHARGYWPWSPTRRQCPPLVPKMGQVLYHSPLQQLGLGRYNYSILPNWIINYITNSYCWLTIVYQLVEGDYELMIFFHQQTSLLNPKQLDQSTWAFRPKPIHWGSHQQFKKNLFSLKSIRNRRPTRFSDVSGFNTGIYCSIYIW